MMKLPEEIDKKYENRKTHEQEFTVEKIDRLERQKQVYSYRLQGYKNQEIADKLGASLSTVEKDIHEIKEKSLDWFKLLIKNGMAQSLVDAVFQIDEVQKELWSKYRQSENIDHQLKILNSIVNSSVKKKELFWVSGEKPSWHDLGVN